MKIKIKSKKIKILSIICILVIGLAILTNSVYAEINAEASPETLGDALLDGLTEGVVNASFAGLATLLSILAMALFLLLDLVFGVAATHSIAYPFPDKVIFNKVAILDPNFTSPASGSITSEIQGIINSSFLSLQSIAISVFAIAAMIMGIKLALTTIAAEKAKYKQAISKWLIGIIVLFMLRYIIAGVFYLNEEIVKSVSTSAVNIPFTVNVLETVPIFGSSLGALITYALDGVGISTTVTHNGYLGLVLKSIFEGQGGNIFSSLIAFIIMGQSIAIILSYFKRLFYSILLSIVSPLIVAVDTVNKSLGLQSKILSTWVKEFTITVFIQSLHALFLAVILKILSEVYSLTAMTDSLQGIIAIILTTALVKFEKVFKGLFGIRTGMMGEIKGGAAGAFKAIHGVRQGVGAVADNAKKAKTALDKKANADKQIRRLDKKIMDAEAARANITNNSNISADSDTSYGDTNYYGGGPRGPMGGPIIDTELGPDGVYRPVAAASGTLAPGTAMATVGAANIGNATINSPDVLANALARATGRAQMSPTSRGLNVNVANHGEISSGIAKATGLSEGGSGNNVKTKIPTDDDMEDMYEEMAKLQQQKAEAESEYSSAKLASIMGGANFVGGLGIGLGAEGDISDALLTGGYVTKGLDFAAEKIGYRGARETRKEIYNDTREKYGEAMDKYKVNTEKILQPKSDIVINPMVRAQKGMASALEVKHMIQGTLTQEMSKEMRSEISKTIRDEMKKENSAFGGRIKAHVEDSFKGFKGVASKHNQFKDSYKYMGNKKNSVDNID